MKPHLGIVYDLPLVLPLFMALIDRSVVNPNSRCTTRSTATSDCRKSDFTSGLYCIVCIVWKSNVEIYNFTILHNHYIILRILYLKIIIPPGKFP